MEKTRKGNTGNTNETGIAEDTGNTNGNAGTGGGENPSSNPSTGGRENPSSNPSTGGRENPSSNSSTDGRENPSSNLNTGSKKNADRKASKNSKAGKNSKTNAGKASAGGKASAIKAIAAIIALCVLVAAALTAYYFLRPQTTEGSKAIHVEVAVAGEIVRSMEIKTDELYLKQALDEVGLIDGQDSGYGFWVTSVNGISADEGAQEWWALYKNGEFSMTGVDATPIEDGDLIEYRLTVGYDDAGW